MTQERICDLRRVAKIRDDLETLELLEEIENLRRERDAALAFAGLRAAPEEDAVEKAQQARDAACNAVLSWMDAEGRAGRLRYNDECPHWQAYLEAEGKLAEALKAAPK